MQQAFQGTVMTFSLAEFILKLQKHRFDLERQLYLLYFMQRHRGVSEKDNSHPFLFDNVDSLNSDCGPYHPLKPVETLLQLSFHSNSEKTLSARGGGGGLACPTNMIYGIQMSSVIYS